MHNYIILNELKFLFKNLKIVIFRRVLLSFLLLALFYDFVDCNVVWLRQLTTAQSWMKSDAKKWSAQEFFYNSLLVTINLYMIKPIVQSCVLIFFHTWLYEREMFQEHPFHLYAQMFFFFEKFNLPPSTKNLVL